MALTAEQQAVLEVGIERFMRDGETHTEAVKHCLALVDARINGTNFRDLAVLNYLFDSSDYLKAMLVA